MSATQAAPNLVSAMDLVSAYRDAREGLKRYKQQHFKSGTKVYVDNNRHRGYGTCLPPDASRPDRVEVLMESGAKWMFDFNLVTIVEE